MCDTSSEAAELATELALYLAATKSEQSERVKQVRPLTLCDLSKNLYGGFNTRRNTVLYLLIGRLCTGFSAS